MSESGQVTVVVADDHVGVAHAITALLARRFATLPPVNSIVQLKSLLGEWASSPPIPGSQLIVLLDLEYPDGEDGLDALPDLRREFPAVRFVIHSAHALPIIVRAAMLEGADGFVEKACGLAELQGAIEAAVAGTPKVFLGSGAESDSEPEGIAPERPLTPALRRVLVCLQAGKRRREIADLLGITLSAVEADITRLRRVYRVGRGDSIDWKMCREV